MNNSFIHLKMHSSISAGRMTHMPTLRNLKTVETISAPSLPSVSNPSSFESDSGLEECQTQFEDTGFGSNSLMDLPTIKVSSYVSMMTLPP
jgi:hypothetical protein